MRWRLKMACACSSVVPTGTVTRFSRVITSCTGVERSSIKRMSRLVMMPSSFPAGSVMGTPLMRYSPIIRSASPTLELGGSVMGSTIMPLSLRLTLRTISACASMSMFLWITPMPPSRAIATAMPVSVTVSIAALTKGMFSRTRRVSWADTSTSCGSTVE